MKIRLSRRIIAMALAFVMVLGMLPATAFARTAGKDGSAEMNEEYAAKESLMPVGPSFSTYTLLEWTVESDPDAVYSRASIPLADRVGGFVVNPLANPEAKLMLCSLANSDHDHTSAQGTESFLSYSFNYWQYVDSFVYWSGSQEGLICCPTGEFIDAAHTNGVPVVATLGFPWGSGSGYVEEVEAFCQKDANGNFPVADKLIEVMDYYGFDGYFFNQESYGCSAATAKLMDEMIHYMHAKRPDMLISWYDSMTEGGGVSYGNAVNDSNKFWMKDDAEGNRGVDEFFMNYNWYESQITGTISTMRSIGRSEFDAFAGIDVQQNCMDTPFRDHLLVDEDGLARISLALYCPNSTLGLSPDGAAFHEVERTFYTNAVEDPRDTSIDITASSESRWAGMSRLFADKTPITSAPFVTDFNSGHGTGYYVDGVLSRDAEWSYQSNQDVMPTWTWIIDSTGSKLSGDYDFTDAYNGGNSIKFHGDLTAAKANDIMIYSTKIAVEDGMTLALTAKNGLENASLVAYLGDETTASYEECEQVVTALNSGEGWVETVADLSAYAGKTLYAIGLKVESAEDVAGYQINLGRITVLDRSRASLNGPASITLDEIMYSDAYTAEVRIQWAKVTGASSYEIYKVHADGSKSLIMATPSTAFYIPALKRAADETDVTIEIVPVNRNGVRGTGKQLTIDWAYGNDDSDEIVQQVFENVALNATITGVSAENSGEPAYKALDGTAGVGSKWCATDYGSGWMSIDIGREVTVKRWRVEHAEYGGEANNMNTIDFALEYKDASGNWVQVKRITDNHDAVTDVLLDTPVTAQEWRLYVYDDGTSPWGGIRIYEWQMFETDQFPQTDVVPMHFASAVNGEGATDTFTLKNVPNGVTVKVYDAAANLLGEASSTGGTVTIENLDFGTADAGRVYYTTTATAAAESAKMSAPFEAESAEKSAAAQDVALVAYSHPGSVTSANGNDIYTTLTVSGLNPGDVVYVYENGSSAEATKVSLPVAEGETSVSINRVLVPRAGGTLELQVKRVGCLISDVYTVETPSFGAPTASLRVYAKNVRGESLTGVRFAVIDENGNEAAQLSTTSDSGAACTAELGTYTLQCLEVPAGYDKIKETPEVTLAIEGWEYTVEVTIPDYVDAAVTAVSLNTHEAVATVGDKVTFTATVTGEGYFSEEVLWTVEGAESADTAIVDGVLTIGADETASYLRVTVASAVDAALTDSAMVYITELANIATNGTPFAYYSSVNDYAIPEGANPQYLFDGDYTTKWVDSVPDGNYAFYGVLLPEAMDIYGVRLHNAGSNGEDASLNTVSFEIWKDIDGDYWDNNTWYNTYYTYSGYYLSQGYGEEYAEVTGNTTDVTTLMFDAPLNTDGLYIKVTDPAAEGDALNIYELELLSLDPAAVTAIKRQVLEDLIAEAEALTADGYTVGSWAVLELALSEAYKAVDDEAASDAALVEAADALRSAIEGLAANQTSGLLSSNATIVAYNGAMLNDAVSGPEKLFDGAKTNPDTDKWCENGKNIWVAFDLGAAADVGSISIYHAGAANEWEPSPDTINTEAYELYVLNTDVVDIDELLAMSFEDRTTLLADNANWTELAAVTGNHDDITTHNVALSGARIFKFNVSDTDSINTWGDCIRVYEIEVMGAGGVSGEVDKSYLQTVIDTVSGLMAKDYTSDSWTDFSAALTAAQNVMADPDATQAQVDEALLALVTAYNDLRVADATLQKILHLDNGRKLYTKDWLIALLNEMSAAGYTHLQLAFGNDGLRFVLDDMSVTVGDTTYASDNVKAGIEEGNKAYYDQGVNALTEAEMDEIIAHAQSVGIQIVPHLNMPGHMDALVDAIEYVGISDAHFYGSAQSVRSLNLNNQEAVDFTLAILEKYAAYFAEKGCYYFHIGADEFANDAYNGNMGFPSMGSALYTKFANFVNESAAIVKRYGMTPRAWNDGISYTSYSDYFDTDIEITYWSSGWWGYNVASAASLYADGHGMINTHGDYYYILGVNDKFTPDTTTTHDPSMYTEAATYDITSFMGGSTIEDPVGGMFAIWGDIPSAETETEVAANIRLILRAMALRMDGESLDGMDTSVVEGGFNEDGTIQGKEPAADKTELEQLLELAESITADGYTEESWDAFQTALEHAREVAADPYASQETVDAAVEALREAVFGLESTAPLYTITIAEMVGGTITADADEAHVDEIITLTITPDEGYSLVAGSLKVNGVAIEGNTFVMPAEDVTITAEFTDSLQQAIAAAEEAKAAAEAAQAAAEEAQRKAEEAAAAAEEAAASAAEDREAAEKAQQEAEEAQAAAEAAQQAAEDAQAAAEAAAAAAEAHDVAAAEAAAEAAKHAQQVAELYQEIAAMKAQMAEYLADTQQAAEEAEEHRKAAEAAELACAKYYALIQLAQYADADDYDAVGQAELEAIVADAIEAINAAESIAEVEKELAKALAAIDRIGYELPFEDVPADSFYADAVKWAVIEGITKGTSDTTFSPNKTVSRAEAVTFLWRAMGEPAATGENPFTDLNESAFYYEAVLWAVENNITAGMTDTTFGPYVTANRAQIVTFLHRALGEPAATGENPFSDVVEGKWYYEAVLWAVEEGITNGVAADIFGTTGVCNRAQMVTFLYRAFA